MSTLREVMDERGLTTDEVAALLNEQGVTIERKDGGSEAVTASDVNRRTKRAVPRGWRSALGVDAAVDEGEQGSARGERAPRRPPEAPVQKPALELVQSPKRIAGAYRFLGAALAAGSGNPGIAVVFQDQADPIADLWLQAAAENPWAARFVNAMQAGGSMGDLAAAHLYLAGACLYVMGAGIPGGDAIFPKYARYRQTVPAATVNGHQPDGSDDAAAAAAAPADGVGV